MATVFDVINHIQRSDVEITWIAEGAGDRLRNFTCDPDQYSRKKARACYRLGYYLMSRVLSGKVLSFD